MSSKNIEFKATLNTAEMDAKIQQLQQKLRTLSSSTTVGDKARSIYGEGSGMTERSQKLQESFNQRNLQALRQEFDVRDRLFKSQENNLKQTDMQIEKAKKNSKEQNDLLKERIKIEEKMLRLNIEQNAIAEKAKSMGGKGRDFGAGFKLPSDATFTKVGGAGGGEPPIFPTVTGQGGGGAGGGDIFGALSKAAFGIWATVKTVQRATAIASEALTFEETQTRRQADINQLKFTASGEREALSGKGIESAFFREERAAGREEATDMPSKIGSAVKNFFSAEWAGFMAGGSQENMDVAKQQVYDKALLEREITNIEAKKDTEAKMRPALEYLQQNKGAFLQAQQMSGMTDEQLMGGQGFLSKAGGAFSTQAKLGAMQGIYGAGGSSAQGRVAGQALEIQRQYGVQGAAGIMGGLSGNIGGGQTGSDSVVRRILADAFSVGLDASKFSRETERFLSISAKFVEQSGARTPEAMARVAEDMGSYVSGTSMKQVEAAGEARAFMQSNLGGGGSQYQQALELSHMRRSKKLSKLSESQRISLSHMTPDQLKAGGTEIEGMMAEGGFENAEEFQKEVMAGKEFKMTQSPKQASRLKRIKELSEKYGFNPADNAKLKNAIQQAEMSGDTTRLSELKELAKESGAFISAAKVETGQSGTSAQFGESYLGGAVGMGYKAPDQYGKELSGTLIGAPTPGQKQGVFTEAQKGEATLDQAALTSAMEYMPKYAQSVKDITAISEELAKALGNLYKGFGLKDLSTTSSGTESTGKIVGPSTMGLDWFTGKK